jgi:hypothetical protein
MGLTGSGQGSVATSCESASRYSVSIKQGQVLSPTGQLQFFQRDSGPRN